MIEISIQKEYDQTVPFTYKTNSYTIRLFSWQGSIMADVKKGEEYIVAGILCTNNTNIVQHWDSKFGNFRIVNNSNDENYPNVEGLGDKYKLFYITPEEL